MFYLTRERQELFDAANTYPFDEEVEDEFKEDAYAHLTEYINHLPVKFQAAVLERTLFKNHLLMVEFEKWCNATMEEFHTKSHAVYEKREAIVASFPPSAQTVFSQSLHDGEIVHAAQTGTTFTLLLDMRGGFTVESMIELVFHEAQTEGTLAGYYIYDELIQTEDSYALRVLSSLGSPYEEWTIFFKNITATYLYRPAVYTEPGEIASWADYAKALNPDDNYFIVENMRFVEIKLTDLSQTEDGIFAGEILLGSTFDEAKERMYCATYENPYAHLSEPIPTEELLSALFDTDQNIRVRAFNTIFELGADVAKVVNDALRKVNINEEDTMFFSIMANHFDKLDCLDEDVKLKWLTE